MGRRIRDRYTVMILRTDKPPILWTVHPLAIAISLLALLGIIGVAVFFCALKDRPAPKRAIAGGCPLVFPDNCPLVRSQSTPWR